MRRTYFTIGEAAQRLNVSRSTVWRRANQLRITSYPNAMDRRENVLSAEDVARLHDALYGDPVPERWARTRHNQARNGIAPRIGDAGGGAVPPTGQAGVE